MTTILILGALTIAAMVIARFFLLERKEHLTNLQEEYKVGGTE